MALDDSRTVGQPKLLRSFDDFSSNYSCGLLFIGYVRLFWAMLGVEDDFLAI